MGYKYLILLLAIIGATSIAIYAQPGLPSTPSQAPIDGGLTLLAAAGVAYAFKKLKQREEVDE